MQRWFKVSEATSNLETGWRAEWIDLSQVRRVAARIVEPHTVVTLQFANGNDISYSLTSGEAEALLRALEVTG